MRDRGVDRLRHAGGRAVAAAVVGRAEMRAALGDLARDGAGRLRVDARLAAGAAARASGGGAVRGIPIAGPLPDIAGHVVEAVAVGREGTHWGGVFEAVGQRVLNRELALPGVGHVA